MKYDFRTQLAKGEAQERRVEKWLRKRGWKVAKTTRDEQRVGIDRWVENSMTVSPIAVEIKADFKGHDTGNAYIETVSVGKYDADGSFVVEKRGWVYTSKSDYLFYLVVDTGELYLTTPAKLREEIKARSYRSVSVRNKGYDGRGVLMPLDVLRKISLRVWKLEEANA